MLKAVFLGALQGATEFLPVSSSGHLVIAQQLLGVKLEGGGLVALDVCLHVGTLLSLLAVFWRDLIRIFASIANRPVPSLGGEKELSPFQARRLGLLVLLGTVPAVIIGFSFKGFFEALFHDALSAAIMLLVTGAFLFGTRFVRNHPVDLPRMSWWHSVAVGLAQAVAIIPGISRSGSTIAAGLYLGLDRALAAKFAFLLAIPAIGGAAVLQMKDLAALSPDILPAVAAGTAAAAIVGFICVKWMLSIVRRRHFSWFAWYCWAAGLFTIGYISFKQ
ncbi:MAG TPA: undecaprenyl-diphosphate phosphatase [bacterium]|nr:undecaprenyl-diphosphate phosphatase [bacterium]